MADTRLLVLGGTHFAGRAVVEAAVARGWDVTILHRGPGGATSPPGATSPLAVPIPDGVTELHGDRTLPGGLDALADEEWDLVVDTWSTAPRVVRDAARALADRAGRYVYVSSRSVYEEPVPAGSDERHPTVTADPDAGDDVGYPHAKAGAERAVVDVFGDRAVLLRAGLILGPGEDIGRLTWWLDRMARGGDVLAPGPREGGVQFLDVRDLADFALLAATDTLSGPYDLVSPVGHATMGSLLEACVDVVGSDARLRWVEPETILAAGIQPWSQLPAWLPPGDLHDFLHGSDVRRALAAGLRLRGVRGTVADTWAWMRTVGRPPQRADRPRLGLDPSVEERVLATLD